MISKVIFNIYLEQYDLEPLDGAEWIKIIDTSRIKFEDVADHLYDDLKSETYFSRQIVYVRFDDVSECLNFKIICDGETYRFNILNNETTFAKISYAHIDNFPLYLQLWNIEYHLREAIRLNNFVDIQQRLFDEPELEILDYDSGIEMLD